MVSEIKKNKLSKLYDFSLEVEKFLKIMQQYANINYTLNELKIEKENYNFFQRLFNKKYKNTAHLYEKMNNQLDEIIIQKNKLKDKVLQFIKDYSEYFEDIYIPDDLERYCYELNFIVENSIKKIESKKTICDFNMDFNQAVKFLTDNNLPVVLEEEDKIVIDNPISFNSLNNFVLVHKTHYLPNSNHISTPQEIGAKSRKIVLDRLGSVEYVIQRNTVHFAVNGEVGSHAYGNWDNCKYAIVVPFPDMPISQLRSGAVMDTYFEGGIDLPKSAILLCPLEEVNEAKKQNDDIVVVGYHGENVTGYADALIGMIGKKVEQIGMWGWTNQEDTSNYYTSFKDVIHDTTPHSETFDNSREKILIEVNRLLSVVDKTIEMNLILTDEEITTFLEKTNIFRMSNHLFLEKNKILFEEIIFKINSCLSKYGIKLSDNKVSRMRELEFTNVPILNDEIDKYNKITGEEISSYDIRDRATLINFLLVTDIFNQVNSYNQSMISNNRIQSDTHKM